MILSKDGRKLIREVGFIRKYREEVDNANSDCVSYKTIETDSHEPLEDGIAKEIELT